MLVYKNVSLIIPKRTVVLNNLLFHQKRNRKFVKSTEFSILLSTFEAHPSFPNFSITSTVCKRGFGSAFCCNYATDSKNNAHISAELIPENRFYVAKDSSKQFYENFRKSIKEGGVKGITCSYQELYDSEDRIHLTLEDYSETISILQKSNSDGVLTLLNRMLEDMQKLGLRPGQREYHALIYANGLHGRLLDSRKILDTMKDNGIARSDVTYSALIEAFRQSSDLDGALLVFREMQENGVKPNSTTYSSLIDLYCKKGDVENAGELYREMIEIGMLPDATTFDVLLNSYINIGNIEKAEELRREIINSKDTKIYDKLKMMKRRSERDSKESTEFHDELASNNIKADKAVSNLLLEEGNMEKVMERFRKMLDDGVEPSSTVHSKILTEMIKSGDTDKAVELFQRLMVNESSNEQNFRTFKNFFHRFRDNLNLTRGFLQELVDRNLAIDDNVYNALISIHVEELDIDGAIEVYNILKKQGRTLNVISFTNLTKTMIVSGREDDAMQFYYEVKQTGVNLDVQGYTTLLDSFVKMRRIAEAQRLFSDMLRSEVRPNVKTYTVLINGLGQQYDYEGVKNIHSIVKMDLNVDLDMGIYNALMDAYNRCGYVLQVLTIWDLLIASEQPINDTTVSIVIDSCGYGREIRRLVQIWNDLRAKKFPLTLGNYHSLIEALARNQLFDEAKYILFNELVAEGFTPEANTIRPLLNFLHDIPGKSRDEYQVIEWVRNNYPRLAKEMKFTNYKK
ncbi:10458_t:CDS:1 [Acaulospora morrowiae]|uniref:10458_t:CDS:1 n=1 Tax=Acaulospora morrowiae TaxID=94023 RepID=A0A9N9APF9_9GLOM|nr:10458_t:CDS:1 [Acaulospora morrowiae]